MLKIINLGNLIIAGFIVILTLMSVFVPELYISSQLNGYLVYCMLFLLLLGILGLAINNKIILFTSFACAGTIAVFLKGASYPELKNPKASSDDISVAHINLSSVTEHNSIDTLITREAPSIISFQEYTPDWQDILKNKIPSGYQIVFENSSVGIDGIVIYTNLTNVDVDTILEANFMAPILRFIHLKTPVSFISINLLPSLDKFSEKVAKQQIEIVEKRIKDLNEPVVFGGEFNQVYWSGDLIRLKNTTKSYSSRRDVNIANIKMPFHHLFYNEHLQCTSFSDLYDVNLGVIGCYGRYKLKTHLASN